jgi:hypothetical protein
MEKLVVGQESNRDVPTDGGVVFSHDKSDAVSKK